MNIRDGKPQDIKRRLIDPHPLNARTHTDRQRDVLRGALDELGFIGRLLVRKTGRRYQCLDGHARLEEFEPDELVPCLVVQLTDDEARKFLATYDRVGELARWDGERFRALVDGLKFDTDTLDGLVREGLAAARVAIARSSPTTAVEGDEDERPAARKARKWKPKPGQVWLIRGARYVHRLACGDVRDQDLVDRLMAGERAQVLHTDPPYGVNYDNAQRPGAPRRNRKRAVKNDHRQDLEQFLGECLEVAAGALADDAAWYVWHPDRFTAATDHALAGLGVQFHRRIIWGKRRFLITRGQYHWQHEAAFFGWRKQPPDYGRGNGERDQSTLWEAPDLPAGSGERKELDHDTPKPPELFHLPLLKHTRAGELMLDPFAGTGPALVAAEQLGRRCYALDDDPECVATILDRLQALGATCEVEQ